MFSLTSSTNTNFQSMTIRPSVYSLLLSVAQILETRNFDSLLRSSSGRSAKTVLSIIISYTLISSVVDLGYLDFESFLRTSSNIILDLILADGSGSIVISSQHNVQYKKTKICPASNQFGFIFFDIHFCDYLYNKVPR